MIKVLLTTCADKMNGTERYAVDIARSLSKEKFEAAIVTAQKGPLSEILKFYNIEEICIDNEVVNYYRKRGIKNLYNVMRRRKFDIVHANSGIIPCILGKFFRVKLTLEIKHGLFFTDEHLRSLGYKEKLHEKLKEKFVDYTLAESENDKNRLIKYFGLKPNKVKVLYNGIDLNTFIPSTKNEKYANDEIIFACIGRFTYQKAQENLVKAFAFLSEKYKNIKLILIGEGENKLLIEESIIENNLCDKVKIYPYQKNLEKFYNELDVLVMPSRFEGIPYVILDSMAFGKPIIATDVGGISEVISEGKNGFIIKVDDIKAISVAMEKFILNRELILKIGRNNLDCIKKFTLDKMIRTYENFYIECFN